MSSRYSLKQWLKEDLIFGSEGAHLLKAHAVAGMWVRHGSRAPRRPASFRGREELCGKRRDRPSHDAASICEVVT